MVGCGVESNGLTDSLMVAKRGASTLWTYRGCIRILLWIIHDRILRLLRVLLRLWLWLTNCRLLCNSRVLFVWRRRGRRGYARDNARHDWRMRLGGGDGREHGGKSFARILPHRCCKTRIIIGPAHCKVSCRYSQTAEASETLAYRNGLKSSLRCTGAPFFGGIRAPKNGFGGVALAGPVLGPLVLAGDAFVG
jgi:hypothetical protein